MSSGPRFVSPYFFWDYPSGEAIPGALLGFFVSPGTTPAPTYSDQALTTPNSNPVVADGNGGFPSIFLDTSILYRVVLSYPSDGINPPVEIWTADPVSGAIFVGGGLVLETVAVLQATSIAGSVNSLEVLNYYAYDGVRQTYKRSVAPSGAGKVQSADGAWWMLVGTIFNVKQFGAKGDGATDDTTALGNANTFATTAGAGVVLDEGTFVLTASLAFTAPVSFEGTAKLSVATGCVVSFGSGINASVYNQLFALAGTASVQIVATPVNVRWFGALGDNTHDDTAAFRSAIAAVSPTLGGCVYLPPCPVAYKITDTITINTPSLQILAHGWASIIKPTTTDRDVFHVFPSSGPNLADFLMTNVVMYGNSTDPTAGALLHLEDVNGFRIDGGAFEAYYGGILFDGAVHGFVDCDIQSDANFTHFAAGSYLANFQKSGKGSVAAEIHIAKSDWRGQLGNNYLHYAVVITGADGIFFSQPHLGFCHFGMAIIPNSTSSQVTSINVEGGYLDTCSENHLQVITPGGYAAPFGFHSLRFSNFYNCGLDSIVWNASTSAGLQLWSELALGNMLQLGHSAVNLLLAQKVSITPGFSIASPSYTEAGHNVILIDTTSTDINIGEGVIEKLASPNTPPNGVRITAAVTNFTIDRLRIINCGATISDASVTANKVVTSALTW